MTHGQSQDLVTSVWRVRLSQQEPAPITEGGSLEAHPGWGVWGELEGGADGVFFPQHVGFVALALGLRALF